MSEGPRRGGSGQQSALAGSRLRQLLDHLPAAVIMFDRDLRVLAAGGEPLTSLDYDPQALTGRLLAEIIPHEALALVEPPYRAALDGVETDFDYLSPVGGRSYYVRARPLRAETGEVVGVLSMSTDLSRQRALEFQLAQARRLVSFGGAAFDRQHGWSADDALGELWGLDGVADFSDAVDRVVHPDDRAPAREQWQSAVAQDGRSVVDYRLQRPSGEVRDIRCELQASLNTQGELVQALAIHLDVTDVVRAGREREHRGIEDERQRQLLLRGVTDLLASHTGGSDLLQATAELAIETLGDGCVVRVVSADGSRVEQWAAAHRDDVERENLVSWLRRLPTSVEEGIPVVREVLRTGEVREGSAYAPRPGEPPWSNGQRYAVVPARDQGRVVGALTVTRTTANEPFAPLDVDVLQLLADRMAAGFLASRDRRLIRREQDAVQRLSHELAALTDDQRRLVLELDSLETRERGRLVDALHDEALQLVVAALLRVDALRTSLPTAADQEMDRVAGMLETAVAQMRSLIGSTTQSDLRAGLGVALQDLAAASFHGTLVRIRRAGPDRVSLAELQQQAAYRIMREALVNARKHAQATEVLVEIRETDEHTVVAVSDDGVGLGDAASGSGHVGLASMRARAALVGGRLRISSSRDGGTHVELELGSTGASDGEAADADASPQDGPDGRRHRARGRGD